MISNQKLVTALGQYPLIFDGAMGSQLFAKGLKSGARPEALNLTRPDLICEIHSEYLAAGSNCITTNTFGANRFNVAETPYTLEEIISAAVRNSRAAVAIEKERLQEAGLEKDCFVFLDIGPLGGLMAPMGELTFEEAYEAFKEQIEIAANLVDGVIIETISDLYEMKAAILAVKETCDLPIFATMTFEMGGRTLMGATPETMVTFLEGIGVQALGVNCSLGPKELSPIVTEILSLSHLPVLVQPNAGLPVFSESGTTYNVTIEEFSDCILDFVRAGVSSVGGCCGTTPEYIRSVAQLLKTEPLGRKDPVQSDKITSGRRVVTLNPQVQINREWMATENVKAALLAGDYDGIVDEALEAIEDGAQVLVIHIEGLGLNEATAMVQIIQGIQELSPIPLQIESDDPKVLDLACRIYNGKPLISVVQGEVSFMEAVFAIANKYGGVVQCVQNRK